MNVRHSALVAVALALLGCEELPDDRGLRTDAEPGRPAGDGSGGAPASLGDGGVAIPEPTADGSPVDPPSGSVNEPLFLDGFFPIGVDVQPTGNFALWKSRGVNTLIRVPQGANVDSWTAEAVKQGLKFIRKPRADPADDLGETNLLGWSHGDEPDLEGVSHIHSVQAGYEALKKIAPDLPVLVNFSGGVVRKPGDKCDGPGEPGPAHCYPSYIAGSDWVSNDIYPVTGWNAPTQLGWVGDVLDKLTGWSEGRPQFAYIETGDQDLSWTPSETRGVTPAELRAELWSAIIHGARGIWYFSVAFNPFRFDNTSKEVAAEMTLQNGRITALADVLQGRIDPPGLSVTVASPLEVTWRVGARGRWLFVLNLSNAPVDQAQITVGPVASAVTVHDENRELTLDGAGVLRDDFTPYGLHIYRLK